MRLVLFIHRYAAVPRQCETWMAPREMTRRGAEGGPGGPSTVQCYQ